MVANWVGKFKFKRENGTRHHPTGMGVGRGHQGSGEKEREGRGVAWGAGTLGGDGFQRKEGGRPAEVGPRRNLGKKITSQGGFSQGEKKVQKGLGTVGRLRWFLGERVGGEKVKTWGACLWKRKRGGTGENYGGKSS